MALTPFNSLDGFSSGSDKTLVIDETGNVTTAYANVDQLLVNNQANLGNVGNVAIAGGTGGQVLSTDGSGNLSWISVASAAGSIANGTSNVSIPVADGNVNTSVGGVANVLVVTTAGANVTGTVVTENLEVTGLSDLGNIGNITIDGGIGGQVLSTDGSGNLSWTTIATGESAIANGTSNVRIASADGNVTVGVGGVSNVLVVTTTGANVTGAVDVSGNVTGGNLVTTGEANVFSLYVDTGGANINGNVEINGDIANVNYVTASGNISANNFIALDTVYGATGNFSTSLISAGNITGGNLTTGGEVVATGNVSGGNVTTTGTVATGNLEVTGLSDLGSVANITIDGGTNGQLLSTDGNGVVSWSSSMANGTSNVSVVSANGNVSFGVDGVSDVVVVTSDGANVNGNLTVTGVISGTQRFNGFDNQTDSTLSYDSGTRTLTISQTGGVKYWFDGLQIIANASISTTHDTAVGGKYYIFDAGGNLLVQNTEWDLEDDVTVCYVYWDGTSGVAWEERHAAWKDPKNHVYLHNTRGAFRASGIAISGYTLEDGSADSKVQYALTAGVIYDEDIKVSTASISAGGPYVIWYRNGSPGVWSYSDSSTVPYLVGASRVQYDNNGVRTELIDGSWVNYYVFATTALSSTYQTFVVPGQIRYDALGEALYEAFSQMDFTGFPVLECVPLYRLTIGSDINYLTTGYAILDAVTVIDREYAPTRFKLDYVDLSFETLPGSPGQGTARIFVSDIANRFFPAFQGPVGVATALQPLLARNKTAIWNPPGNATTIPGVFGFNPLATLGSPTARSVNTSSYLGRMKRLGFRSNTALGSLAGGYTNVGQYTTASAVSGRGGFFFVTRFGISDEFTFTDARMFVGVTATTVAPQNVEPDTLINCLGIAQLSTDTTQLYVVGGGTIPQTPVALGASFGSPTADNAYEIAIFAPQDTPGVWYWTATNLDTDAVRKGSWSGDSTVVPPSTLLLAQTAWRTNNGTNERVGLDICSIYMETDE